MIKKWNQFITESKSTAKVGDTSFWTLSEDDIRDISIELEHNNYFTTIEFGFLERVSSYRNGETTTKDVFTEDVNIGDDIQPAYWIRIQWNNRTTKDDITDSLYFIYDTIKERADAEISLQDESGEFDVNDIKLEQGAYLVTDNEELELEGYLSLFVKEKKQMSISAKFVADYYSWEVDETKGENVYLHIDVEDLAEVMLSRRSDYKNALINGIDDRDYDWSGYRPDVPSTFDYSLDKENVGLIIKSIIQDNGGATKLIEDIGNEKLTSLSQSENIKTSKELEDLLSHFLLHERFKTTLTKLCKDSEIYQEVSQTIGDWELQAHIHDNQEEIWDSFIDIVNKDIENYTIIEKEVKSHYTNGKGEKVEYTENKKFFSIPLSNDWIKEMDSDSRYRMDNLRDVFREWSNEMGFNYELNPRFSDYGSVDKASLNKEIRSILEQHLGIRPVRKN